MERETPAQHRLSVIVRPGEDDMPERVPIVDFDHHSALVAANPAKIYTELRNTTPVFWCENYGGYWVFTKYAHLAEILTNPDK
ncbi:MAG TPA: hypothetical protein VNF91_09480, partial [Candidatus Acidoferrum sp.]|nr:hypothetical protein [Candidatus Acidoferrum sp.]